MIVDAFEIVNVVTSSSHILCTLTITLYYIILYANTRRYSMIKRTTSIIAHNYTYLYQQQIQYIGKLGFEKF